MNTTVISGRLVRNPGYNEVENEKGLHKIAKFVLAVRRNYSDEVSFIPVKAFAKKAEFARDYLIPEDAEGFLEIPEGMEEEMPFR